MTDTLDIFMEESIGQVVQDRKKFSEDFQAGKIEETQKDYDALATDLEDLEKIFKEKTLEPSMDLYQKIKQLLHLHVAHAEKQMEDLQTGSGLKEMKKLLKAIDGNRKTAA